MHGKTYTAKELLQHVMDIAQAFNVQLLEQSGMKDERARASVEFKVVQVGKTEVYAGRSTQSIIAKPVHDEASYAIAMHELGHVLHPNGLLEEYALLKAKGEESFGLRMVQEEAAWEWAEHHALDWTPTMEHVKMQGLQSYHRVHAERERLARESKFTEAQRQKQVQSFIKRLLK